jgi:hypothetical protein
MIILHGFSPVFTSHHPIKVVKRQLTGARLENPKSIHLLALLEKKLVTSQTFISQVFLHPQKSF